MSQALASLSFHVVAPAIILMIDSCSNIVELLVHRLKGRYCPLLFTALLETRLFKQTPTLR